MRDRLPCWRRWKNQDGRDGRVVSESTRKPVGQTGPISGGKFIIDERRMSGSLLVLAFPLAFFKEGHPFGDLSFFVLRHFGLCAVLGHDTGMEQGGVGGKLDRDGFEGFRAEKPHPAVAREIPGRETGQDLSGERRIRFGEVVDAGKGQCFGCAGQVSNDEGQGGYGRKIIRVCAHVVKVIAGHPGDVFHAAGGFGQVDQCLPAFFAVINDKKARGPSGDGDFSGARTGGQKFPQCGGKRLVTGFHVSSPW